MFWCYIFLVTFYIACCCLDGNDIKPRWHRAVADILGKEANKLFRVPPEVRYVTPNKIVVRACVEHTREFYRYPDNIQERIKRDQELMLAEGIGRELLRNHLIKFDSEITPFGEFRKIGYIQVYKDYEDIQCRKLDNISMRGEPQPLWREGRETRQGRQWSSHS